MVVVSVSSSDSVTVSGTLAVKLMDTVWVRDDDSETVVDNEVEIDGESENVSDSDADAEKDGVPFDNDSV